MDLKLSSKSISDSYLYASWLDFIKQQKTGYFLMSNTIEEYLPLITTPAMNLYIFYAIHSKNHEGSSYYSIDTIANKLGVSQKTISNWNKTLSEAGLITRNPQFNSSTVTQLNPTTDFILNSNTNHETINLEKQLTQSYGYEKKAILEFGFLGQKTNYETYFVFSRKYTVKDATVTRFIFIKKNYEPEPLPKTLIPTETLQWIDTETENNIPHLKLIHFDKTVKITDNIQLELLDQLKTEEDIKQYKQTYNKLELPSVPQDQPREKESEKSRVLPTKKK